MLECMSDYLSLIVMVLITISGFYMMFVITDSQHDAAVRNREEMYYSFYESMDDEFDDSSAPYYEE